MIKILQITDLHLVAPGLQLRGLDPERRLRECLAEIEAQHGDAEALIMTGDLTDEGDPRAYDLLKHILADYRLPPAYLTIGNHDDRQRFGSSFPDSVQSKSGFAHQSFLLGNHVGIVLDTWECGSHAGSLCPERLLWLSEQLRSNPRPTLLFMHHAPFKVGLKRLDALTLVNEEELWAALSPFRERIRHLFFGHMHRIVSGSWRGIPFTVVPAVAHHGLVDFNTEVSRSTIIEPFYSVILVGDDNVVVHSKQVSNNWTVIEAAPAKPPAHMR
jgi:3',5'-cyclic AMP phosphodiesterase CpdA